MKIFDALKREIYEIRAHYNLRQLEGASRFFDSGHVARRQDKIRMLFRKARGEVSGWQEACIQQAGIIANFVSANRVLTELEKGTFFTSEEQRTKGERELRLQFAQGGVKPVNIEGKLPEPYETRLTGAFQRARIVPWYLAIPSAP